MKSSKLKNEFSPYSVCLSIGTLRRTSAFNTDFSRRHLLKQKIDLGFSPINDKTFREHYPQYDIKELNNDKLIHHHVGGGGQAVAVPSKLHPGSGGIHNAEKAAGVWGNDSGNAELLEKFLNK